MFLTLFNNVTFIKRDFPHFCLDVFKVVSLCLFVSVSVSLVFVQTKSRKLGWYSQKNKSELTDSVLNYSTGRCLLTHLQLTTVWKGKLVNHWDTYWAASLINFLNSATRLLKVVVNTISVTIQNWISLKRRRNKSKLAVIFWNLYRPNTW